MNNEHSPGSPPRADGSETAGETARARVAEAVEPVRRDAQEAAERQKSAGADQIGSVARAVHAAASELEPGLPGLARRVHDAAARLEDTSSSLRGQSIEELFAAFNRMGRSQPGAVFGGAVLAGFALCRFLKSSGNAPAQPGRM